MLDAAVPLHAQGLSCALHFSPPGSVLLTEEVIAINTATRHCTPEQARGRVENLALRYGEDRHIYKKTDSTLRGNISAELAGLVSARPGSSVVYAPALPGSGRTVRDGSLLVDGVPVEHTAFARDPLFPVRTSSVREVLGATFPLEIRSVALDKIRIGGWLRRDEACLYLLDGETAQDLDAAAREIRGFMPPPWVLAGPAGLSRRLPSMQDSCGLRVDVEPFPKGATLLVCGSLTPRSLSQASYARRRGWQVFATPVDPDDCPALMAQWLPLAGEAFARGRGVVLQTPQEARTAGEGAKIAEALAVLACTLFKELKPQNLVVFGGETASDLLGKLGINHAVLVDEMEAGVNRMRFTQHDKTFNLVCKSGGFGGEGLVDSFT